MHLDQLTAISPIDGRYRSKTQSLDDFFSEYALIRYRIKVEILYFIALARRARLPQLANLSDGDIVKLKSIYTDFTTDDAARIKHIEERTNHDVKAVEYFIKEHFDILGLSQYKEFVHFGLTSQDINNTALPMSVKDALKFVIRPAIIKLIAKLATMAQEYADTPMLARTHGQPASPTKLGKEIAVFAYRLKTQLSSLDATPITGKFGGATGNFNAHLTAYPTIDWRAFADTFLNEDLGIGRESFTTQISNYDNTAALFDALRRINTIIIDLDRDFWSYISMKYFNQKIRPGEVGSSAMPHKVNPIDFENSEGNLGIANALLTHLSTKLPISRLQRDLTDSTVTRNIGVPFAHTLIAIESTIKGLDKLIINRQAIDDDLNSMWAVVAEGIQTILRREGFANPYETLKALTRTNTAITGDTIAKFIDNLDIDDNIKDELRALSPMTYTGY